MKSKAVMIRLTEEQRVALEAVAEREDRTITYVVRRAIDREIARVNVREKKGKRP